MNILLIEDDAQLADSMMRVFDARGWNVKLAGTVELGLSGLRFSLRDGEEPFDVILSDYQLPDGTGLDFYRRAEEIFDPDGDYPTRILWSGLDRSAAAKQSGLEIEHVLIKSATLEVLELIEARQ